LSFEFFISEGVSLKTSFYVLYVWRPPTWLQAPKKSATSYSKSMSSFHLFWHDIQLVSSQLSSRSLAFIYAFLTQTKVIQKVDLKYRPSPVRACQYDFYPLKVQLLLYRWESILAIVVLPSQKIIMCNEWAYCYCVKN
jgi:hypothetical protein